MEIKDLDFNVEYFMLISLYKRPTCREIYFNTVVAHRHKLNTHVGGMHERQLHGFKTAAVQKLRRFLELCALFELFEENHLDLIYFMDTGNSTFPPAPEARPVSPTARGLRLFKPCISRVDRTGGT